MSLGLSACGTYPFNPYSSDCSIVGRNLSLALFFVDNTTNLPTGSALAMATYTVSNGRAHHAFNLSGTALADFVLQPNTKYAFFVAISQGTLSVLRCPPRCAPHPAKKSLPAAWPRLLSSGVATY